MLPESPQNFLFLFPAFFVALWLAITVALSYFSGWTALVKAFPDRDEPPSLRLSGQSGSMGSGVNMRGILTLGVCPSGLRVGIMRVFGPFSRDFLVPWRDLSVSRKTTFFMPVAELQFGSVGTLSVGAHVADRLGSAAGKNWPEPGSFLPEAPRQTVRRLLAQWALVTGLASLFFIGVTLMSAPKETHPPIAILVLFPAIVFGVGFLIQFFRERN